MYKRQNLKHFRTNIRGILSGTNVLDIEINIYKSLGNVFLWKRMACRLCLLTCISGLSSLQDVCKNTTMYGTSNTFICLPLSFSCNKTFNALLNVNKTKLTLTQYVLFNLLIRSITIVVYNCGSVK